MSYLQRILSVSPNPYALVSSGSGDVAYTKFNSNYYFRHSGTAAAQLLTMYSQITVPVDAVSATSVNIVVNKSGSTNTLTITAYINGVADATINAYNIKPTGSDGVDNLYTVPFGSLATATNTVMFAVASTVDANEAHRVNDLKLNYITNLTKP
jgi:hypothetical protein